MFPLSPVETLRLFLLSVIRVSLQGTQGRGGVGEYRLGILFAVHSSRVRFDPRLIYTRDLVEDRDESQRQREGHFRSLGRVDTSGKDET